MKRRKPFLNTRRWRTSKNAEYKCVSPILLEKGPHNLLNSGWRYLHREVTYEDHRENELDEFLCVKNYLINLFLLKIEEETAMVELGLCRYTSACRLSYNFATFKKCRHVLRRCLR
jgi:hypothetical protein